MVVTFISACAGAYSGSSLNDYICGLQAWHILHGLPWSIDQSTLSAALTGAARLAPPSSSRPKREPFTVSLIIQIQAVLNLSSPFDIAFFACLTTTFWAMKTWQIHSPLACCIRQQHSHHMWSCQ